MAQIFLTTTGTNSWTVPSDWNSSTNTIEVIGSGANGTSGTGGQGAGGSAGGGYAKVTNAPLVGGQSLSYTIDNSTGGVTIFDGTTQANARVGATGGTAGTNAGVAGVGGIGFGTGATVFSGGAGQAPGGGTNSGGGGGAAGPNGNGIAGGTGGGQRGGSGDNGSGGIGSTGAGGNGAEYDATHGSGAGGAGNTTAGNGFNAGTYGGGAGGGSASHTGGLGTQGLIVITYTSVFTSARYWVGGTGTWDASDTTHWSATSGGSSGASAPTSSNEVVFDFNSGSGTVTLGADVTVKSFNTTASTTSLSLTSHILSLSGTGTVWAPDSAFVLTPGTSTIKLTDASSSAKTFAGAGFTYNNIWMTGVGTGAYTITGSNTFNDFKVDTPPHTVNFQATSNQTVSSFTVNGTPGNLMTLQSTVSGTQWILSSSNTISCDYLSLQDSRAVHL